MAILLRMSLVGLAVLALCLASRPIFATESDSRLLQKHTADSSTDPGVAVPEPTAKAIAWHREIQIYWVLSQVLALGIPLTIWVSGFSVRLRDWAWKLGRGWYCALAIYLIFYLLISTAIRMPLAYYVGFLRLHDYGLSNQTFLRWLCQVVLDFGLTVLLIGGGGWFPFWVAGKLKGWTWLGLGVLAWPVLTVSVWLTPMLIDPLYHKHRRLDDRQLEARLLGLAEAAGINGSRIFVVQMSQDTNAINAYVHGFGSSHRIVIWDTALDQLSEDELVTLMAHEIGHYVLGHVRTAVLLSPLAILAAFGLTQATVQWWLRRSHGRTKIEGLADFAVLPVVLVIFTAINLVATPARLAISRASEREADLFALELTRDNEAAARAFVALGRDNLSVPYQDGFDQLFRASHPSLAERIEHANGYRPWQTGEPLRFADRIDVPAVERVLQRQPTGSQDR